MTARKQALLAGTFIFLVAIFGSQVIGRIYSEIQARQLIEALSPSLRSLCLGVISASATIISLLLTTVSFVVQLDSEFDEYFYRDARLITRLSSWALFLAVFILLLLTIPITESDTLESWFSSIYYVLMLCSATLATLIVATIIVLYRALNHILDVCHPNNRLS
jgi:hypothetical protein